MSNNDNLKGFISKLNDRNLQRKRESGITSYVLYSVLIFCSYKLYKNLSFYSINNPEFDLTTTIHLTCFISNSLVGLYFILLTFQTEKKAFSNLKVIKYDKNNFNLFGFIITFFLFSISSLSLIFSFINKTENLSDFYYLFLGILNVIPIIFIIEHLVPSKKQVKISNTDKDDTGLKILIILTSLVVIFFSTNLALKISLFEKFIFIKIIVLLYTILFILEKIVDQERNDVNTFNLENFEYEIYLKNLNDEQIRERLQKNYIGYLIDYWIDYNQRELKVFKEDIDIRILDNDTKLAQLESEVDKKKYPIEYEGRKKSIYGNISKELEIKLPKFQQTLEEVAKILKERNNLTENEVSELTKLQSELTSTINKYKKTIK